MMSLLVWKCTWIYCSLYTLLQDKQIVCLMISDVTLANNGIQNLLNPVLLSSPRDLRCYVTGPSRYLIWLMVSKTPARINTVTIRSNLCFKGILQLFTYDKLHGTDGTRISLLKSNRKIRFKIYNISKFQTLIPRSAICHTHLSRNAKVCRRKDAQARWYIVAVISPCSTRFFSARVERNQSKQATTVKER